LFVLFTLAFGNLLGVVKPELKFSQYNIAGLLTQIYFKLFLSSLGILSIQFLLSLLFRDFLKPMGIGFVATITGVILASKDWEYAYTFPYSHPMLTIITVGEGMRSKNGPTGLPHIHVDVFSKEILVSLAIAILVFVAGYFIVLKKSVK
ncbi:MAG: family transporter protein, partial [Mucilaginibacter sp.]|nr:family transporter protein [Mucilaginibacter sp.]